MQTSLLILAGAALSVTAMGAKSLTPEEMMSWKNVCAGAATPSEKYAATEFQRLFKEMGGKELPLVEAADASDGAIFVGPDAVLGSGQPTDRRALEEEALRIRVTPNAVCIDGGRPRGTLYGVYEFYEELCGVRFLTFDHTYFPPDAAQRTILEGVHLVNPTFVFRWSYYGETSRYPDFAARLRINSVSDDPKLGGRTGYRLVNHNVAYLVPPAKWGKKHPEYFAHQRSAEVGRRGRGTAVVHEQPRVGRRGRGGRVGGDQEESDRAQYQHCADGQP